MMHELTTPEPFEFTVFENDKGVDEMVVVRDIQFVSLCPHHLLPYIGVAHVGYIPGSCIAGLSKLARTVKNHARNLVTQEELTQNINNFLVLHLVDALGVAVVMRARHLCLAIRGATDPEAWTVTSALSGVFKENGNPARTEFLTLVNGT